MTVRTESLEHRTVLVVDDDRALLHTLKDILGLQGYEVETADQGSAAIRRITESRNPPLVAVLDVGLPDVSGLEVAERVKDCGGLTQVVILTGDASVQSAVDALRASSVDYLVKPVDPHQLYETIERAFERALRRVAETELEAERRRRADILSASPVGFIVRSGSGAIEYVNPFGARILGLPSEDPDPDEEQRIVRWLGALGDAEPGEMSVDLAYQHPERGERVIACRFSRLEARDSSEGGALIAFTDVTESRRVEDQLRQTQKLEAIGRLAGGVAHDFNNLLTVILANAEFLAGELPEEAPYREDLDAIRDAAVQAADVARQLLTFSRRDPGRVEAVDVNQLVTGLTGLLARTMGPGIAIRDDLDPTIPHVEADAGQLRQVIMNLAMNARDAMEGRGGTLTFRTGRHEPDDLDPSARGTGPEVAWLYLDVVDTGVGMDEETRARVFEPFFTTKMEGKGTGLGLATVYGIVSQMGGLVDITSEPGEGTTFRVSLPASASTAGGATTRDVPPAERSTILVVDDEERLRTLVRRLLVRDGHRVLEASHGREALEVAERHDGAIDLLLTDQQMPGLPPSRFVPTLLEAHPDMAVVVITGSGALDPQTRAALPEGVSGVLAKPFDVDAVRDAVSRALSFRG